MYHDVIKNIVNVAIKKVDVLKKTPFRYILLSAMAGMFVGLAIILIFTIGGTLGDNPFKKTLLGASFGIALSLVIMIGSELFTGNSMILTIGSLDGKVKWIDSVKVWIVSYIGNLLGAIFVSGLFVLSTLNQKGTLKFFNAISTHKMSGSFSALFFKGILCNILVCLAVYAAIKLKEETAKLIMIWWCLFAFITSGYEHSIANMTVFAVSLFSPHSSTISLAGAIHNLIPVTLGNFVGGACVMGLGYWFIGREA